MSEREDVQTTTPMQVLVDSCKALTANLCDFWLLAALTDRSFEEGKRNPGFAESIRSFEAVGVSNHLIDQLRRGINGNLAAIIASSDTVDGPVQQNRSRVPDIRFRVRQEEAFVEVKLIYDCTARKYYASVARDGHKLLERAAPHRWLLQAVFFVQLPSHNYPAGMWYGKKASPPRTSWLRVQGIRSQFDHLMSHMSGPPTWPGEMPHIRELGIGKGDVDEETLLRWYDLVLRTDVNWRFNSTEELDEAAVGVAVWKVG